MNSITLCFLMECDFAVNIHSFESLGLEYRVIESDVVYEEQPKEYAWFLGEQIVDLAIMIRRPDDGSFMEDYFKSKIEKVFVCENDTTDGKAYNDLFRQCTTDYVCVLKPNVFFKKDWLTDLMFYCSNLNKSGAVSLLNDLTGYQYLPMINTDEEESVNVFIPRDNHIADWCVLFFNRQMLYFVGALSEEKQMQGCEWIHWQNRAVHIGLTNYCIPTQSCYTPTLTPTPTKESKSFCDKSLLEMRKAKNYYLPL